MAIAHISRAVTANIASSSTIISPATAHVSGNLLVALIDWGNSGNITLSTVTDTAGNVYTKRGNRQSSATDNNRVEIWEAHNIIGNAANVITATLSTNATYRVIVVHEFSGCDITSPFDTQRGANGASTGTTMSTGILTLNGGGIEEVIVAFVENDINSLVGGAGYTLVTFNAVGDAVNYFADEWKIVTVSEAATATGGNNNWYITAAAFRAPYSWNLSFI